MQNEHGTLTITIRPILDGRLGWHATLVDYCSSPDGQGETPQAAIESLVEQLKDFDLMEASREEAMKEACMRGE